MSIAMFPRRRFLALGAWCLLPWRVRAEDAAPPAMRFSSLAPGAALPEWLAPITFGGRVKTNDAAFVADEGRTVLRFRSQGSSSGFARAMRVDPAAFPMLTWQWKTARLLAKGGLGSKEADDFPVRLYVTFDLDPSTLSLGDRLRLGAARAIWGAHLPSAALCYVWDGQAQVETVANNAYTDRVRMIVVQSGAARLGHWVTHERNVAEDYRRAFGAAPPAVSSLIVSADTDNTGESTESWFGDAAFRAR